MPRKIVPIVATHPYHITARCINREWFDLPLPTVWSVMEDYLFLLSSGFGVQIHSFVLMANHFHLLATAPNGNLSEALLYFMRESSKEITRLSGRINQTYGGRNHKTWISNDHHFLNTYKYVYYNPVQAGVCRTVEEYPYSTLRGTLGYTKLVIPIHDEILHSHTNRHLEWLNTSPEPQSWSEMRLALRGPECRFRANQRTKLPSDLNTNLL